MKINPRAISWTTISNQFSRLLPFAEKEIPNRKPAKGKGPFLTFGQGSMRGCRLATLEQTLKEIDLELLERIGRDARLKSVSYQGFISSHLQHGPVDDSSQ